MKSSYIRVFTLLVFLMLAGISNAADIVPNEVQLPGTQPGETNNFESPNKCDNCHAGYNDASTASAGEGELQDEPATGWRGAAMGNAGRDPIFWATMAVAEQDFDGAGDLCIRCHSTGGWYGGRSTPTDASGLAASDSDGVDCDTCHSMTNTDDSELIGIMNPPFVANCSNDPLDSDDPLNSCDSPDDGYYGSGMTSIWAGSDKLGPYSDADARHRFKQSKFHRSVDFCGTCHDVSNSVVGDLAPGNGTQPTGPHVVSSQDFTGNGSPDLGGPIEDKAAFNNPPYAYGVVERTFSEYKSSALQETLVADFTSLPPDLQVVGGSLEVTYQAALLAGTGGNYADGEDRYFSCQSCHMRPTISAGANKRGVQIREDLPQHDHTGGNYWLPDMIKYQDSKGQLRLGGGLSPGQLEAINLGQLRAVEHLQQAASLVVEGDSLKVVNLTGHKLISGYPEGRRMWLNIKWYNADGDLVREDGKYGPLFYTADEAGSVPVMVANPAGGPAVQVESILDLDDPNIHIYEAHYAMSKEWAETLVAVGKSPGLVLSFDRYDGEVDYTLGELATGEAGYHETFHFALNNQVVKDNRIPPYEMSYDEAEKRNALPVPADQYGNPGSGGVYDYWDLLLLNDLKPGSAVSAEISLLYQGTSWEYIQFLNNANNGLDPATGGNAFLGAEGVNMLEAWINAEVPVAMKVGDDRKMVPPVVMASATWGTPPPPPPDTDEDEVGVGNIVTGTISGQVFTESVTFVPGDSIIIRSTVVDGDGNPVPNATVTTTISGPESITVTAVSNTNGLAEASWQTRAPNRKGKGGTATGSYTATVSDVTADDSTWDGVATSSSFTIQSIVQQKHIGHH